MLLRSVLVLLLSLPLAFVQAGAQSVTGYSYIQDTFVKVPVTSKCQPPPHPCAYYVTIKEVPVASVYSDTEEDYTASLYYNIETANAVYYEDSNTPLNSQDLSGNPSQALSYNYAYPANGDGIYSETTAHLLDFFYITSIGEYYDPFGYSATNGEGDGNWDSGFWFYAMLTGNTSQKLPFFWAKPTPSSITTRLDQAIRVPLWPRITLSRCKPLFQVTTPRPPTTLFHSLRFQSAVQLGTLAFHLAILEVTVELPIPTLEATVVFSRSCLGSAALSH